MTAATDPKRRITVEASNQLRRMATKPGYVVALEQKVAEPVARPAGVFDNAGGAFPFDVPSEAFTHHLAKLDEAIAQAEHQVGELRRLAQSIRDVAEGHDPSIHEPPPPPEAGQMTAEDKRFLASYVSAADVAELDEPLAATIAEIEAEVLPPIVTELLPVSIALGWTCPVHGQYAEAVSRKNRPYRYCPVPDCGRLDIMLEPSR